jgi:hypothetical protein
MKVAIVSTNPEYYSETKDKENYLKSRLKNLEIDGVEFYSTHVEVESFFKEKSITSYDAVFISTSVTHPRQYEPAIYDFSEHKHVFLFTGGDLSYFKAHFDTRSFYYNVEKFLLWLKKYGTFEKNIIRNGLVSELNRREEEMKRTILSRLKEQKTLTIVDIVKGIKLQPLPNWIELINHDEIQFLLDEANASQSRQERVISYIMEAISKNDFELFEKMYNSLIEDMFSTYKDEIFKKDI